MCADLLEVVVYYSDWNEAASSSVKLHKDVPLGLNLNGAIVAWPELS